MGEHADDHQDVADYSHDNNGAGGFKYFFIIINTLILGHFCTEIFHYLLAHSLYKILEICPSILHCVFDVQTAKYTTYSIASYSYSRSTVVVRSQLGT